MLIRTMVPVLIYLFQYILGASNPSFVDIPANVMECFMLPLAHGPLRIVVQNGDCFLKE